MQPSGSSRSADTIINSSLQPNSSSSFLSSEIVGEQNRTAPATRKRRLDRACDQCRRRKTRCDGIKKAGGTCSNCRTNKSVCTYV
ncbi:hypothetical protein BDP27DRAFT_1220422 [Rhodocollybia butyracea]|uniref:Zn(2)-C6 fungal-type domain-containing protein n=1 Tax=Rhodocollybia butyracea TaxID=206335 RepID=A0A9P5PVC7_9AGAR|nr:hypothetical protein BDP27DRAFT_1220422 [Rhodocollybia butyracea]